MICKNCGAEIVDGSLFCNKCGAKIEPEKRCPNCNQVLSDDSDFCPYCGTKIKKIAIIKPRNNLNIITDQQKKREKTKKKINKKRLFVIIGSVFAVLMIGIFIFGITQYDNFTNYQNAKKSYENEYYSNVRFISITDNKDYGIFNAQIDKMQFDSLKESYDAQDYKSVLEIKDINADFGKYSSEADQLISSALPSWYDKCVKRYRSGDRNNDLYSDFMSLAENYNYSNSKDYYMLLRYRDGRIPYEYITPAGSDIKYPISKKTEEYIDWLKSHINFEDAKSVALYDHDMAQGYLLGTWKDGSGYYYFTMNDDGWTSYNFPFKDLSGGYTIEAGIMAIGNSNQFRFSVVDFDTCEIYCYSNGNSYLMFRQ